MSVTENKYYELYEARLRSMQLRCHSTISFWTYTRMYLVTTNNLHEITSIYFWRTLMVYTSITLRVPHLNEALVPIFLRHDMQIEAWSNLNRKRPVSAPYASFRSEPTRSRRCSVVVCLRVSMRASLLRNRAERLLVPTVQCTHSLLCSKCLRFSM